MDIEGGDSNTRISSGNSSDRKNFLKMAGILVASTVVAQVLQACRKLGPTAPAGPLPATTGNQTPSAVPALLAPAQTQPLPDSVPAPSTTAGSLRARLALLLRRAGFGASKTELDRFEAMGLEDTVDYLLDYETVDDTDLESGPEMMELNLTKAPDLQRWWLLRMIKTKRPLLEKMVFFWHGLLTSGMSRVGKAELMLRQNQLFRQQAMGSFPVLLKKVSRDPAMLIWLDSRSNKKAAPNENFARELMELFTMGVGNYSEEDVRESARAFTGWFLRGNEFSFEPSQFDNGTKNFLGESGIFNGDDIINIIVKQPATSDFICRKLFSFFAYDPPDIETISNMRSAFAGSGYNIKETMRQLLTSDAFYLAGERSFRPKSPVELVAGTIRSLGIKTDAVGLPILLTRMGQTVFNPPNVAGWPGGGAWFNSSALLERINFANRIATDRSSFNPQAEIAKYGSGSTAKGIADYFINLLLDENMPPLRRQVFYDSVETFFGPARNTDVGIRAVVYLLLSSPDYQLV